MVTIEKRLMRYIPADLRPYVVWLDFEPYSAEPADNVRELRWNAQQLREEMYGN